MHQDLPFWGTSKNKIWLNEPIPIPTMDGGKISACINVLPSDNTSAEAAIEVFKHIGPTVIYGFLGGVFHPNVSSNSLNIELFTLPHYGIYSDSLAGNSDSISIGIEAQYTTPILNSLVSTAGILGPGTLSINRACCGAIGSSPSIFDKLSKALVQCLVASKNVRDEDEITRIIFGSFI